MDIGSSKISAVVAQIKGGKLHSLFCETVPSHGIKKGVVINSIDVVEASGRVLKSLKLKSHLPIKSVCVNISGQDIITKHSRAVIPLAERSNKVITLSDIRQVNEQARILGANLEEEIIHSLPVNYAIDSQDNVLSPLGLYSHRLEVDLYLICAKASSVESLGRLLNQAGYEVRELLFSGLATSRIALLPLATDADVTAEGLEVLCDIGSDITEIIVFKEGFIRDIKIIYKGADDITRELAENLKIPYELAEEVKISYASVSDAERLGSDREILVKRHNLYKPIKQKAVVEIATTSAKNLCQEIKEAIDALAASHRVKKVVACGRGVLLEGFLETLENTLSLPCRLARIREPGYFYERKTHYPYQENLNELFALVNKDPAFSGQKYLSYLTALGMLAESLYPRQQAVVAFSSLSNNPLVRFLHKAKEIYREYF